MASLAGMAYEKSSARDGAAMSPSQPEPVSRFYSAEDGLKLHLREWPSRGPGATVVCLPGLARTAADFDALATRLAGPRRAAPCLQYHATPC